MYFCARRKESQFLRLFLASIDSKQVMWMKGEKKLKTKMILKIWN